MLISPLLPLDWLRSSGEAEGLFVALLSPVSIAVASVLQSVALVVHNLCR